MNIKELLENARPGMTTAFEVVDVMTEGGKKAGQRLEIHLNHDPKEDPKRAESQRRAHVFHDVPGFVSYLKNYGTTETVVLANVEQKTITATLNEESANGREVVKLVPMVHPMWAPWRKLLDQRMKLDDFVMHVRRHRRSVREPDARELILALSQITARTEIQAHHGKGKKCLNGLLVKTEIQGQRHEEIVELPDALMLGVPLFLGRDVRVVELDINVNAPDRPDAPITVEISSGDILAAEFEEFSAMVKELDTQFKEGTFALGSMDYEEWEYQKPEFKPMDLPTALKMYGNPSSENHYSAELASNFGVVKR